MRASAFALTLILSLSIACGGGHAATAPDADPNAIDGAPGDAKQSTYAVALLTPACAPDDGPALTLALGQSGVPSSCAVTDSLEHVLITIYQASSAITAPMTIDLAGGTAGVATFCPPGDGACPSATAGTVTLDTFVTQTSASGSYSLDLGFGGGNQTGTFDAVWCDPGTVVCGG